MAERTANHAGCTRVEWDNDEEAVEQLPCGRDEPPRERDRHVDSDDCANCSSRRRHIRPETVLSRWWLVGLGIEIAEADGDESEEHRCQETLGLTLLSVTILLT